MWAALALIPVAVVLAVVLAVRNHVQAMPAGKDHGTVGLAVRMWAYYQVVTVIGLGVLVGVLLLAGLIQSVKQPPAAPPQPERLITRETWKIQVPKGEDEPQVWWGKMHPPPKGFAYNRYYYLVALPPDSSGARAVRR